jgi:hypothetical protein
MLDLYSLEPKEARFNNFCRFYKDVFAFILKDSRSFKGMKFVYNCPLIKSYSKSIIDTITWRDI